jgi:xanthine dehydrogenase accessory factor
VGLAAARVVGDLASVALTLRTAVVVATHGRFDEDALEQALRSEADYVSLVASPTRARVVVESLRARAIPDDRLRRLKAPAGLDLGAVTPEEIAVSILAEIVARRRRPDLAAAPKAAAPAAVPTTALDPVCGMTVTIATARHRSDSPAGPVYFCCGGCKQRYDREPDRYPAALPG